MKLAVFTKNRSNPAYAAARLGAERAAAQLGASVAHYVPETPDHPAQQSVLIDEALATRPDAFVFSPVHATRVNAAIGRIVEAGIPMVGFVNPIPVGQSVAYVGADDSRLASEMANYLVEHLQGKGTVLVVTGPVDSVTSLDRLRGFGKALKNAVGIRVVGQVAGDYSRSVAHEHVGGWLRSRMGRT